MAYRRLLIRRDTAANWTAANPTLAAGELGGETDTGKTKLGNGSTAWNSLAYQGGVTSVNGQTGVVTGLAPTASPTFTGTVNTGTLTTTGVATVQAAATQDAIKIQGRAGGTSSHFVVFTPTTLSASRTLTLPDTTGTVVTTGDTGTVTSTMLADGTIVNADISASAAISTTKITNWEDDQPVLCYQIFS